MSYRLIEYRDCIVRRFFQQPGVGLHRILKLFQFALEVADGGKHLRLFTVGADAALQFAEGFLQLALHM